MELFLIQCVNHEFIVDRVSSKPGFGKILPFTIWPLGNRSGRYTGKVKWMGTYTGHVHIRMVVYLSKFKRFIGIPVTWRSRNIIPDTAFGLRWYTGILLSCRYIPNTDTYSADWRRDDITGEYCATSTRLPSVGSTTLIRSTLSVLQEGTPVEKNRWNTGGAAVIFRLSNTA